MTIAPEKRGLSWSTHSLGGSELRILNSFPGKAGADASSGSELRLWAKNLEGTFSWNLKYLRTERHAAFWKSFFFF